MVGCKERAETKGYCLVTGIMVAADAYHGLYRMDLNTGKKELLVPANLPVDGRMNSLINSVAVTQDGKKIYYTTSR